MQPWPIEEVVLRPAVTLLFAAAVPFGTAWLLRKLLAETHASSENGVLHVAAAIVGLAQVVVVGLAGLTALGPVLVERRDGALSLAFAALAALIAAGAGAVARRAEAPAHERPTVSAVLRPRLRQAAVVAGPLALGALPTLLWPEAPELARWGALALGLSLGLGLASRSRSLIHRRSRRLGGGTHPPSARPLVEDALAFPPRVRTEFGPVALADARSAVSNQAPGLARAGQGGPPAGAGYVVGLLVAALLGAAAVGVWTATRIELDGVSEAGEDAARWRLRIDPWDERAMLAAGWAARDRDAYVRARAWAGAARERGAPEAATLELEAELEAARGACDAARATFDRALRARAAAAFADPLASPLPLGGFRLPPTLVSACGGLDGSPGYP